MRILVSCKQCDRQYDGTDALVGQRFRCHCGSVLLVEQPQGHEAAVIRCSSCGGPRMEGENRCRFCDADFTVHERDLNTVCPQCFARVSDQAKFCPHCAAALAAESMVNEPSELLCPVCDEQHLQSRALGVARVNALECPMCAGLWLGPDAFERLQSVIVEKPEIAAINHLFGKQGPQSTPPGRKEGPMYRKCVYCDNLMSRNHYGGGAILDICRTHGIWFDDQTLRIAMQHLASQPRAGGKESGLAYALEQPTPPTPPPLPRETPSQALGTPSPEANQEVANDGLGPLPEYQSAANPLDDVQDVLEKIRRLFG